ncbi:iron chelate uptake ABC transporter family permease subunit [Psychrobacter sp. FDAARGOS_221]|uniref:iron chelate uptake ABC transporter family permease subunit n=1 Tax=Psychrobacter sp. FDAARGOS_221 TaxID=1975705 RepID=UPI000BB58F5F|nr:iron chelate uptake ABC transporter family permease subunit [Psychrobacter sp. FDAARGOS_221]PNK60096.1 enterobactin ABC transporter permease [Psychrobacter sp. FDAARGOS_221]
MTAIFSAKHSSSAQTDADPQPSAVWTKPVCLSLLLAVVSCVLFISLNAHGNWDFVIPFRSQKLIALMIVGYSIGVSTLLFQSLTHNPILTPSLLGFDALYVLIQSVLIYFLGTVNIFTHQPLLKFGLELLLMVGASLLLFRLLFTRSEQSLSRLILVGIVFGVLFRSLSNLVARLISPEDFVIVQALSFAQFNTINTTMMWVSLAVCAISAVFVWRWRYQIDVLLLGRNYAINLGIDYQALTLKLLVIIALLVATATSFVGPVIFLGLLVCALTNRISRSMYHSERLVLVSLVSIICLVLGQALFEQVLGMAGVLAVVIELLGGIVFIALILKQYRKQLA